MNIDSKTLEQAINEIKDEKFKKEMRQWIVFGSPPEVGEIFKRYCDKMEEMETRNQTHVVIAMWLIAIFVVGFVVYHTFSLIGLNNNLSGCLK